jgi:hypothetical protein
MKHSPSKDDGVKIQRQLQSLQGTPSA